MTAVLLGVVALLAQGPASTSPSGSQDPPAPQEDPLKGPRPTDPAAAAPPRPLAWRIRAGLELIYDSNVIKLDDRDVRRLEDGLRPDKFRIEEPDDLIVAPWVEAAAGFDLLGAKTWGGLAVRPYVYATNDIMNYEELELFLRQDILDVEYEFEHDRYKREYRSLDTGLFESAYYSEHTLEGAAHVLPRDGQFRIRATAGVELRDYESPFSHRDHLELMPGFRASFEATSWLELELDYDFVLRNSFARSGQPDTSFRAHVFEPGVEVTPAQNWSVQTSYAWELRDYTTDNDPAVDADHRDREDVRRYWSIEAGWKPTKTLGFGVEYQRSQSDSDLPHDPGATDEETEWSREEFLVNVTVRF